MSKNDFPPCLGLWLDTKPECAMCRFRLLCEITIGYFTSQEYKRARGLWYNTVLPREPPENCFGRYYGMFLKCALCPLEHLCEWTFRYMKQICKNSRVITIPSNVKLQV